jgi:hypothetical protein
MSTIGAILAILVILAPAGAADDAPGAAKVPPFEVPEDAVGVHAGRVVKTGERADIVVFPKESRLEADAWFCVTDGEVEYLAVTPKGKLHETLFVLEAEAKDLQLGLILLGLKEKPQVRWQGEARPVAGDAVTIEAEWAEASGARTRRPVLDLVYDTVLGDAMKPERFVFTGSRFVENPEARFAPPEKKDVPKEVFAATSSGSLIALYHDPDAILENPLVTGGDIPILIPTFGMPDLVGWVPGDERHRAFRDRLPPRGTRATLHVRVAPRVEPPTPSIPPSTGGR